MEHKLDNYYTQLALNEQYLCDDEIAEKLTLTIKTSKLIQKELRDNITRQMSHSYDNIGSMKSDILERKELLDQLEIVLKLEELDL